MRNGLARSCVAIVLLLLPAAASAQEPATETLVPGRRSIQVGGFQDGASLGFWSMRSPNTQLGIVVDARAGYSRLENEDLEEERSSTSFSVNVGPELRRYSSISGRVAPYGFIGGNVRFAWRHDDDGTDSDSDWNGGLGARLGLGAEFFPAANFSIGGQMGVGANVGYTPADDDGGTSQFGVDVGTFGASLMAAIYF